MGDGLIENFPLGAEYAYYLSRKPELLRESRGKYALIKGRELAGIFETEEDALERGTRRYGESPFLIVRIDEEETQVIFSARGGALGRRPLARRGRLLDNPIVEVDIPPPPDGA